MAPPSFRIDSVCTELIHSLEGTRRTWIDAPEGAPDGFRRHTTEALDRFEREHNELMGDPGYARALREHVLENFLPRYTRLARDHNAIEGEGYKTWRRGDPVARLVGAAGAFFAAMFFVRVVHHPLSLLVFGFALLVPLLPELKGFVYRRQYSALLTELVEDMARLQGTIEDRSSALLEDGDQVKA